MYKAQSTKVHDLNHTKYDDFLSNKNSESKIKRESY